VIIQLSIFLNFVDFIYNVTLFNYFEYVVINLSKMTFINNKKHFTN